MRARRPWGPRIRLTGWVVCSMAVRAMCALLRRDTAADKRVDELLRQSGGWGL